MSHKNDDSGAKANIGELVYGKDIVEFIKRIGLDASDIDETYNNVFLGKRDANGLTGVVGLEIHGDFALLRSLAVSDAARGQGLGKALVKVVEDYAIANNIKQLFLFTTGAETFFTSLGYGLHSRSEAPIPIASSSQFSSPFHLSSIFMSKIVVPDDDQSKVKRQNEQ